MSKYYEPQTEQLLNVSVSKGIYRFRFNHEFKGWGSPYDGMGVYVDGLPKPFILFRDWSQAPDVTSRGHRITFANRECPNLWAVTEWLGGIPPSYVSNDTREYEEDVKRMQGYQGGDWVI